MTHKNFPSNTYKGYLIQFFIVYNWLQPNLFSLAFLFQERNVCIFHVLFIPTWQGEMILNPKFTETRMEKTLWKIVHEKANNLNNQIAREKKATFLSSSYCITLKQVRHLQSGPAPPSFCILIT